MKQTVSVFFVLAFLLAATQVWVFQYALPSPDSIAYFEVADQIRSVGYVRALSEHWSPLYSLCLFAVKNLFLVPLEKELLAATVSFAVLIFLTAAAAWFFLFFLSKLLWRDESQAAEARRPWMTYGLGLALFFLFVVFRVNLRLPDVLVFGFALLSLGCWCESIRRGLGLGWAFAAGILAGLGFLARANVFHWSLVTGALASWLAVRVSLRRRLMAYGVFLLGLVLFFAFQLYAMSAQKGRLTFGESGKTVFAAVYGAEWKKGGKAWPVSLLGGDVRVFTEEREVNFPGFYDVGREFKDAVIPFRFRAAVRGILGAFQSALFGYYSPREALIWPMWWAFLPLFLFGIPPASLAFFSVRNHLAPGSPVLRRRMAVFLVLAGLAGLAMHFLTYAIGYYLPPYLFMLFAGLGVLVLEKRRKETARHAHRSLRIVGAGFALTAVLYTLSLFRSQHLLAVWSQFVGTAELSRALEGIPKEEPHLRRIAVAGQGQWLGLYGVRLSGSQVYADLPNLDVFKDSERFQKIVQALRERKVAAVLASAQICFGLEKQGWKQVEGTPWCLLVL